MDDLILQELKRTVEQAVRPVRATMARKRRMREELLAHLVAIFEEEAGRLGDEPAALKQARLRFGDPRELTGQLQQAVPWLDRCRSVLENMGCQPGESAWHLAVKHFLVTLPIYLLLVPTWVLACGHLRQWMPVVDMQYILTMLIGGAFVGALFNVILSVASAPLLNKIGSVLASKRWGRIILAMVCSLVLLFGLWLPFTGVAVLLILMVRQTVKQWRYQADWAQPAQ
ncbi:MAG: hypothetical protein ABFC88_02375 [Thermoguttaceae bacterium]